MAEPFTRESLESQAKARGWGRRDSSWAQGYHLATPTGYALPAACRPSESPAAEGAVRIPQTGVTMATGFLSRQTPIHSVLLQSQETTNSTGIFKALMGVLAPAWG